MNNISKNNLYFLIIIIFSYSIILGQNKIPSSNKSKKIIDSVYTLLKEEFNKANIGLGNEAYIRIFKLEKELEVWVRKEMKFELFKTYPICTFGSGKLGPKLYEGDGQAPEGFYSVGSSSLNPFSRFHLSINVGYPNEFDRSLVRTGSAIMIHGDCVSIGCFAMTDSIIEKIYTIVEKAFRQGQKKLRIDIFPFRFTEKNLDKNKKSEWIDFWLNLKEGYDLFEINKIPPKFVVKNNRYVFNNLSK